MKGNLQAATPERRSLNPCVDKTTYTTVPACRLSRNRTKFILEFSFGSHC